MTVNNGRVNSTSFDDSELSNVRFCLAPEVTFSEQNQRGEIWVIIRNSVSNKHFSTTPLVRDFVEQFRTVNTLSDVMNRFSGCNQLPAEQWLDLLGKLMSADILSSPDFNHDDIKLQAHVDQQNKAKHSKWSRPWMIKIPLGNPNLILSKLARATGFLWTLPAFVLWVLLILWGGLEVLEHFSDLQLFWSTRFLDPTNIVLALFIYPVLKFVHEMGHGLAAKHWGADVVETGVLLILFVPLPYIDVSQSSFFPQKYQRMVVAAAGMIFELSISVVALMVWVATDSILLKDVCMNVILIGAVSSVFFNANPLLKFDGYYLLSDFIEIPNLSTRAAQMSKYVVYHHIFKLPVQIVAHSLSEARWLLSYGVLSQSYRLAISFYIAMYLGSKYFFIGVLLALWLIAVQILKPWTLGLFNLFAEAKKSSAKNRAVAILGSTAAIACIVIFVVPFQFNQSFRGILMLDGPAEVKAYASGFVTKILVRHNERVSTGQVLFYLENANIEPEMRYMENKIKESDTLYHLYREQDPAQAAYHADQTQAYQLELDDLKTERESMSIRSPVDGHFQKLALNSVLGRYIPKGTRVGDVISPSHLSVVLMLTEEEMRRVEELRQAKIVLPSMGAEVFNVIEVQATPGATAQLPSPFLGTLFGGGVPVDTSDSSGIKLLKPMFRVALKTDANKRLLIGESAWVKSVSSGQSLAAIALRKLQAELRDRGALR